MMISKHNPTHHNAVFVWIWLPDATAPVVAGQLTLYQGQYFFTYGQRYLANPKAIALYDKELPLVSGNHPTKFGSAGDIFGVIRDAAPDSWGRRVILQKLTGQHGKNADTALLNEMTYLMESDSNRIGALDFQSSASEYKPRASQSASLEDLMRSAEYIEAGKPLPPPLAPAIGHGTSLGGARPKAMLYDDDTQYIAKFSSSSDQYNAVKAEFVAMRLAQHCGLNTAAVRLESVAGKAVLLIRRFDRGAKNTGWARKAMVSALTLLGLTESEPQYASYEDLAEIIRHRFHHPQASLKEMFGRMVFNILCGNTDDHARNHAAFWDGRSLTLTPAYDIAPLLRVGGEASQAMLIAGNDRLSRLTTCLHSAENFMLSEAEARQIIDGQIETIKDAWDRIAAEAELTQTEKTLFRTRIFLNPYGLHGYNDGV